MTLSGTDIFLFAVMLYVAACFIGYLATFLYPFMTKSVNIGKLKRVQKCYRNIAKRAWIAVPVLWLGGILTFPKVTVITQVEPEYTGCHMISTFRADYFLVPFYYKGTVVLPGDYLLDNDTDSTLVRYEVTRMNGLFMNTPTLEGSKEYKPRSIAPFEYTRYKFHPLPEEYYYAYHKPGAPPEIEEYLTLKWEAILEMKYISTVRHKRDLENQRLIIKTVDGAKHEVQTRYNPLEE